VSSRRQLKAAEAIREVVATSILTDIRDPRVQEVTVLGVEVSPDMREAKVSVSVMGDEAQQNLSLRGLQNSAGFLQAKIAQRIETRYIPKLRFVLDPGVKSVFAVGEILARIRREQEADVVDAAGAGEASAAEQTAETVTPADPLHREDAPGHQSMPTLNPPASS